LKLLQDINWLFPDATTIVLSDRDNPTLVGLAWELGAWFVFTPPLPWELLPELLLGLTQARHQSKESTKFSGKE
jgi:hypothetical protein